MKRTIKTATLAFIFAMSIVNAMAFTQMRNWVILPNRIQLIYGSNPQVNSISGASSAQYKAANGVFDENNNLLFYVRDGEVYDASSNYIGWVVGSNPLKEVVIVPVPGQCKKYYVIVAEFSGFAIAKIYYSTVDANSGTITMTSPVLLATFNGSEACGMAASKIISGSGSSAIRYLYCITLNKFSRFTISSSGIGSKTNLTPSGLSSLTHQEFYPSEAELNHAGTRFAWGSHTFANSGKVYEITTSSPTLITHTLTIQSPCTTANHSISGLEYDANGNLWVSATSSCTNNKGLYKIVTSTSTSTYLGSSTQNYDFTQLELTNYDRIFGVSNSGSFGYINPSNNTFSTSTYSIPVTIVSNAVASTIAGIYSLPDQIDGESYFYYVGVAPALADFKINNVVPNTNCGSIQSLYNCNAIAFSNLSTGATSYVLEVNSMNASCSLNGVYNYNSGTITTLPTDLRNMPGTGGTYLASNTGRFRVHLTATNGCVTTTKTGYILVNGTPTTVTSCFKFANNTTCSGSGVSGSATCASATVVCMNNPKIKADCSGGQFVQGSFDIVIDEYNNSCVFIQNVGNSLNNPLASTADLVCLSLNDFTTTPGYFYGNPSSRRYRVRLTIRNVCSDNTSEAWFIDNLGSCKTSWDDETETTTGIEDAEETEQSVSLFPNPSAGGATLQFNIPSESKATAYLYDLQGSVAAVLFENRMFGKGTHNVEIQDEQLALGIYIYNLIINEQSFKGKFVKTN